MSITKKINSYYNNAHDLYIRALIGRARLYEFIGDYDSSLKDWKSLQRSTKLPKYLYEYYSGRSLLYERLGRFRSAAAFLKKALILCKRHRGLINEALILSMRIRFLLESGDYKKVISWGLRLLNDKRIKSLPQIDFCRLLTNIGNAYLSIGEIDKAHSLFLKAHKIYRSINDLTGLSIAENNLALVYWKKGDYKKALKHSYNALNIRERIGHRYGVSATLNNLGLIYDEMGKYQEALRYYEKALEIFRELNDTYGMTIALTNIGSIYSEVNGDINKAIGYYKRSVELCRLSGDTYGLIEAMIGLAGLYWFKRKYFIFERLVGKLERMIETVHSEELKISFYMTLIKMYARKKLYSKVGSLIRMIIKKISVSKNYLLRFESTAAIIDLIYEQQMHNFLIDVGNLTKIIEKKLDRVESPLKRAKILCAIVKYYLLNNDKKRAAIYYQQWQTIVHSYNIRAHFMELDRLNSYIFKPNRKKKF